MREALAIRLELAESRVQVMTTIWYMVAKITSSSVVISDPNLKCRRVRFIRD